MTTRRKYINGVQNPYEDTLNPAFPVGLWADCPKEAIIADPSIGYRFFEDFTQWHTATPTSTTITGWTVTQVNSGSATIPDSAGGYLDLVGAVTAANGLQAQKNHEVFKCAVDKTLWFEARLSVQTSIAVEFFCGLAINDTSIIAGSANSSTDHIAWQSVTDDGVLLFSAEKAGTGDTESSTTLVAGTKVRLGFKVSNATATTLKIEHYVDDVLQSTTHTNANVSVLEMKPSLVCQGGGSGIPTMHVDYIECIQLR